jgi:predicted CXXCH cytochrome family protein
LGRSVHPPIETDGCVICHNPHFSDKNFLLAGNFPSGNYAKAIPENFDLCFTCHDSELMMAKTTVTATNFRNGNHNLHFIHINGDRGRNCTICHDVHGSPNEKLIKNSVPFGQWTMNLNYKINENGGSCATGCHGLKQYSRKIPGKGN